MRSRRLAAVLIVVTIAGSATPAAASRHDARAERERVARERARVAADLDVLRADAAEVDQALAALETRVARESAALAAAQSAVAAATKQAQEAAAAEQAAATQIQELRTTMRDAAVAEYINGGANDFELALSPDTNDVREVAAARVLRDVVTANATDVADALEAAREDHAIARAEAEAATKRAEAARSAANARLANVQQAHDQQASFAAALDERVERRLAEAASLEALDRNLAGRIAAEQAALARRTATIARPRTSRSPVTSSGDVPLTTVRGITVHTDIADQLEALLDAAEADGFNLSGGGYRDPSQQRRLREQNCPDPDSSPASSCNPPTARPGQSMHEQGKAVDFTWNGRLITSRSNAAFQWLARNASRFGLRNLPEEPWHWSTNGR